MARSWLPAQECWRATTLTALSIRPSVSAASAHGRRPGIILQPDGKLLALAGTTTLVRYQSDGSIDATFGTAGRVTTPWSASSFAVGPGGRIVLAGNLSRAGTIVLARYLAGGSIDSTFGAGGTVTLDIPGRDEFALAVAIQPDSKIVVAGSGYTQQV